VLRASDRPKHLRSISAARCVSVRLLPSTRERLRFVVYDQDSHGSTGNTGRLGASPIVVDRAVGAKARSDRTAPDRTAVISSTPAPQPFHPRR
jgi:hypothetical protein